MKALSPPIAAAAILGSSFLLSGCSTSGVQHARSSGVENRQDRIDSRTAARRERQNVRSERADARATARFDSW